MTASVIQETRIGNASTPNLFKAFASNVTAGSTLHVIAGQGGGSGVTYTFSDNNGGSYTILDTQWDPIEAQGLCHAVAYNHPGGATTVEVAFSINVGAADLIIREIGGVSASPPPLDGHALNYQTSTTTPSASATNGNEPALWSAFCYDGGGGHQPTATNGTSGITLDGNSGCTGRTSSSLVATEASQTANFSATSSAFITVIAIFDAGSGGGGTNYSLTAAQGSYSLAGETAHAAYGLGATQGSFGLTGFAATLSEGGATAYSLTAALGTFSLTGESAQRGLAIPASEGSFGLTGYAAHAFYSLGAAEHSFGLTGFSASLLWSGAPKGVGGAGFGDLGLSFDLYLG